MINLQDTNLCSLTFHSIGICKQCKKVKKIKERVHKKMLKIEEAENKWINLKHQ